MYDRDTLCLNGSRAFPTTAPHRPLWTPGCSWPHWRPHDPCGHRIGRRNAAHDGCRIPCARTYGSAAMCRPDWPSRRSYAPASGVQRSLPYRELTDAGPTWPSYSCRDSPRCPQPWCAVLPERPHWCPHSVSCRMVPGAFGIAPVPHSGSMPVGTALAMRHATIGPAACGSRPRSSCTVPCWGQCRFRHHALRPPCTQGCCTAGPSPCRSWPTSTPH